MIDRHVNNDMIHLKNSKLSQPEFFGRNLHILWPDGAAGGDHQHQEAADPEDLEGGVYEGPGPEPGHPLHPLHDHRESQHPRGSDSNTGGDNLQQMLSHFYCS